MPHMNVSSHTYAFGLNLYIGKIIYKARHPSVSKEAPPLSKALKGSLVSSVFVFLFHHV